MYWGAILGQELTAILQLKKRKEKFEETSSSAEPFSSGYLNPLGESVKIGFN